MGKRNGKRGGTDVTRGQGFQPGNTLPRRKSEADKFITQQLIACLHETRKLDGGETKERVAIACDAIVTKFESGDLEAAKFVIERIEGKMREHRTVDGSVDVNHTYDMSRLTAKEREQFASLGRKSLVLVEDAEYEVVGGQS